MPRHRPLYLIPCLLLAILVAGLGGSAFQRKIESFQPVGASFVEAGGAFRVTEVDDPETGLEVDDTVLLVRQETPAGLLKLYDELLASEETALLVQRGEGLETLVYQRPDLDIDWIYLILAGIGVLYLLIGLYTSLNDRRSSTRLFVLWCITSSALFLLSVRQIPLDLTDRLIFLVDQAARTLLPALTLHLFLVFPGRLSDRRWMRRAVACLYLPALLSVGFYVDQTLLAGRFTGPVDDAFILLIDRIELIFWVAAFLGAALTLAVRFHRRPEWEHRRQLQWIVVGLIAGHVPFLVAYVLPWVLNLPTPTWSTVLAVAPMGLVPLTFAYAIFKYRLLDMGSVLRDAVSYSAAGIVAIFGFQGAQLAIEQGLGPDLGTARNMMTFAAGLVIAGVLVPTRNVVAEGLERLQHRGLWGRRRLLHALGSSLLHERDLEKLCTTLTHELSDSLAAEVELYLRHGEGRLVPMHKRPEIPDVLELSSLGDELWRRDVESLKAIQLPDEVTSPEQHLYAAGYRYAFPLRVQGHPVGMVLMSYKYGEDPLDGEDLELVQGLLSQAALAIENAGLLDELRHKLEQVSHLQAVNQGILDSSPAGIAMLDADDRIVSANPRLAQICGVEGGDLDGRPLGRVLPVSPPPLESEGPVEIGYCTADGKERYLQLQLAVYRVMAGELGDFRSRQSPSSALSGEGSELARARATDWAELSGATGLDITPGPPLRVLIVQDVTEKTAMEMELREKEHMASLGVLAAGVAHEVNTPLTGISSYTQFLIAGTPEDDPRFEMLQKVERQTFRASQIVNNLLEFSRNRRGEMSPVELGSVLRETQSLLEARAAKAHADLILDAPSEPCIALGNEGELHQVFTNLVANALDALVDRPSPRRVTVTLEKRNTKYVIRVVDTGPGIPAERLKAVFKPFFSSKLGRGGTGLGLAIAYNILRRHAGHIQAENNSEEQGGCTFTVELPAYQTVTH